ncbi:MAG: transcriptional repressor LexA [Angelakisella sp.]|jgi:repressor LexA|nr:transcriptional repressor LexA [Angelakisella sp.]
MADLNPKALQILEYIRDRLEDGLPPSVREICAALEIKSTSTAHKYLGELQERGLIEKGSRLNRAITLPDDRSIRVPLVGTVTAGQPILAVEEIEGYIPYRSRSLHSRDLFALRVRGDSMINVGILDGDIIIIRQTPTAENGDIVVALIEDEATVKRFYKEKGHYRLQPENDTMEPIIVDSVSILGRVVSLIREYEAI